MRKQLAEVTGEEVFEVCLHGALATSFLEWAKSRGIDIIPWSTATNSPSGDNEATSRYFAFMGIPSQELMERASENDATPAQVIQQDTT